MKRSSIAIMMLVLAACSTASGRPAVPSPTTIARIESGTQLVRDLTVVGAYGDPAEMNAESRVKVRRVECVPLGADAAECSYEASRCIDAETDSDHDGWCARTARFARLKFPREPFDVMVRGWAPETRPSSAALRSSIPDLAADPPVAEIIRFNTPVCLDSSPDCETKRYQRANALADQYLSLAVIASDATGAYALFQRDLISRPAQDPRIWVFRDPQANAATSLLWKIACDGRTYVEIATIVQDERGQVTSYRPGTGTALQSKPGTAPAAVVDTICKAPVRRRYMHP